MGARTRLGRAAAAIGLAAVALAAGCLPPGEIDPDYGEGPGATAPCPGQTGGLMWTPAAPHVGGVVTVACGAGGGHYRLATFDPKGNLDPSFAGDGVAEVHGADTSLTVARTSDGAVLTIALTADESGAATSTELRRFLPDGSVDLDFGDPTAPGGVDFGGGSTFNAIAPLGTGAATLSSDFGFCEDAHCPQRRDLELRVFDEVGQVGSTTFVDLDGFTGPLEPGEVDAHLHLLPTEAAWDADGRLLAAGITFETYFDAAGNNVRYQYGGWQAVRLVDGAIDPTYGNGGMAQLLAPNVLFRFWNMSMQGGEVIMVGPGQALRVDATGLPDPTFGEAGTAPLPASLVEPSAVAVDHRGRIVVGGITEDGTAELYRLLPDGALDEAFGDGGRAVLPHTPPVVDVNVVIPHTRILAVVTHLEDAAADSRVTIFRVGH